MTESSSPDLTRRTSLLSGIVVCRNEASRLVKCLGSLNFCDERIVIDLASKDDSRQVARAAGARVITAEPVPIVEQIRARVLEHARHDWIIFLDPDEEVPPALAVALSQAIQANFDAGTIRVPRRYHVQGRPIRHGYWAGPQMDKTVAINRRRAWPAAQIHGGWRCLDGFREIMVTDAGEIVHHWADSFRQLLEKHIRYLPFEAEARAARGDRFGWSRMLADLTATLRTDVVDYRALAGGPRSWLLVLFHQWYQGSCWLALRRFSKGFPDQRAEGRNPTDSGPR